MSDLSILFQDQNFIAVDKPTGLSIHNNEDRENLISVLQKQKGLAPLYPVHRLDKETSGVQVLALNETAAKNLAEEFQSRTVKKVYVGLLRGTLKTAKGVWRQSLTDRAEGRKNPAGMSNARVACETQFTVLKATPFFTLCEFNLITGRQHQIRKHVALANHALVGDSRYGDPRYNEKMADLYKSDRMFLHCEKLFLAGREIISPLPIEFEKITNVE